jgi:hypothetical protein
MSQGVHKFAEASMQLHQTVRDLKIIAAVIVAAIVAVLGAAVYASASCNTIPLRMSANCVQLGMPPDCVLDDEVHGKKMYLTVITTDDLHQLATDPNTGVRATAISLTTRREAAGELYKNDNDSVPPEVGIDAYMEPEQPGPGEFDVSDCEVFMEKLVGQSDVEGMGEQLRDIVVCGGLPYIAKVYERTCEVHHDGVSSTDPTVVGVWVWVNCLVPA